jgi:Xaa-Pro dipeptidase
MGLKTFGLMAVDWEQRVDIERLRQDRLNRIKAALKQSELGALLCFDMNNIRYAHRHLGDGQARALLAVAAR